MKRSVNSVYSMSERFKCMGLHATLGGSLLLAAAFGYSLWILNYQIACQVTEGTVIALQERVFEDNKGNKRKSWYPVIEYQVDAKNYVCTGVVGRGQTDHAIGEKVNVAYLPAHPDCGRLDSFVENWLPLVLFLPAGSLLTVVGVVLLCRLD